MTQLVTHNRGPLIIKSNYWGSDMEQAGKIFCSVNSGAIRILLPRSMADVLSEWRTAEYVICSRGPWQEMGIAEAIEFIFEDHSDRPFALHLTSISFDRLPAEPDHGKEWVMTAWVQKQMRPYKALERPVRWRRVMNIPDMSKWDIEV